MQSQYNMWRTFHLIICVSSLFGWYVSVNTTESNLKRASAELYSEETKDAGNGEVENKIWLFILLSLDHLLKLDLAVQIAQQTANRKEQKSHLGRVDFYAHRVAESNQTAQHPVVNHDSVDVPTAGYLRQNYPERRPQRNAEHHYIDKHQSHLNNRVRLNIEQKQHNRQQQTPVLQQTLIPNSQVRLDKRS